MGLFHLARPALFSLPAETAHNLSIKVLKSGAIKQFNPHNDSRLNVSLAGLEFPNPLGLAAGYDKNAEVPDAILGLGFGSAEVGTITPKAQAGNPKPRVFRAIRDGGVINRLGFNNEGHATAKRRLQARNNKPGIVGVNIGANKDSDDFVADYEKGIDAFYDLASYFTVNISSPNTPGLRNLQAGETLEVLINRTFARVHDNQSRSGRAVPVFLKIAPDLSDIDMKEIADVVLNSELSALIVSNTTLDRTALTDRTFDNEPGGLSGKPLFERSTHVLAAMYRELKGSLPLVGVGGIMNADDAITKIKAGATLVQLYSGMVYEGPEMPNNIIKGMSAYLDANGQSAITDMIGSDNGSWS